MRVNSGCDQSGSGLIEVLVALVIFGIGLLATYSVQTSALSAYQGAGELQLATYLGRDIIARIRGNSGQLALYNVEGLGQTAVAVGPNCYRISCSPTQLVQSDLGALADRLRGSDHRYWEGGQQRNAGGLVGGRACIRSRGRWLSVTISWSSKLPGLASQTPACGSVTGSPSSGRLTRNYVIASYIGAEL